MAIASTPRSKSSQRAKKARVAARTRVRSIDAGEDIDGCDFTTDITLDEDLPAAFGAVEAPPKTRPRKGASPKKTSTKSAGRRSTPRKSSIRKTRKRSTKTPRGS